MTLLNRIKEHKWVLLALLAGLVLGWLLFHSPAPDPDDASVESHEHAQEETTWTCSMHPQIRQDEPGQCPICGMDLIPLSSTDAGDQVDPDAIAMTESTARLADIQTLAVTTGSPEKTVYLQGKVEADERNIAELTARFGGRIDTLFVSFTGETVRKADKLARLYSPGLIAAQRELLEARALQENRPSLYDAARIKLKLWDLTDEQIAAIEEQGEPRLIFDVLSPISGTVMQRHVALGDYVEEGSTLFRVVDLSNVWVVFDAYESDLPWIRTGDAVELTLPSIPGETYTATVTFVDPVIDPQTRTAGVRVTLSNPEQELKPGMFVRGVLKSSIAASSDKLLIPKTAILWTGKRAVVYVKVDSESPTFRYREITLGAEAGDVYVVEAGLTAGEEVAVNGVFKIDAAAQLEGKPSMMNPEEGAGSTGHDRGGKEMSGDKEPDLQPDVITAAFREQLTQVYTRYLDMTEAFIESNPEQVSRHAGRVLEALEGVNMSLLQGEAHRLWMVQLNVLTGTIRDIESASDLESQRETFSEFNLMFYKTVKTFGLTGETIYYQYCPMANRDSGAYWFSDSKEIRNPYFGDAMLQCGETRETIE